MIRHLCATVRAGTIGRRGFTFIEVLFAVILLGIGFIMIAAVFPVALQQNQSSAQETNGTLVARGAIKTIQAVAFKSNFPGNFTTLKNQVIPFGPTENAAIGANAFFTADHRFGWAGFYRRVSPNDPFMQVWVVALQNQDFANTTNGSGVPPNVAPFILGGITANFSFDANGNEVVDISNGPNAVEGAYVIVANGSDNGVGGSTGPVTGRVFRLGTADSTIANRFQLAPGFDMIQVGGNYEIGSGIPVFIIGRAPDPTLSTTPAMTDLTGPNQDLIVQTSYVRLIN